MSSDELEALLSISANLPHIPAKPEAHLLKQLMSKTGYSEAEIREIPKYRKMLSNAQHKNVSKSFDSSRNRHFRDMLRNVTKETGLTIEHPVSLALAKERIASYGRYIPYTRWTLSMTRTNNLTEAQIVSLYHNL